MSVRSDSERSPSGVTPYPTDRPTDRPEDYVREILLFRDMSDGVVDKSTRLRLAPVTKDTARRFVGDKHRHNLPPGHMTTFQIGCIDDDTGELRGVAIVGRPSARGLDDGRTAEVLRLCTDGATNACSMLYGACKRAARALGYTRLYTYTLQAESGASLKASGWTLDAELDARPGWGGSSVKRPRVDVDLFGNERTPREPKYRWKVEL